MPDPAHADSQAPSSADPECIRVHEPVLDVDTAPGLCERLRAALDRLAPGERFVVDLTGVEAIDPHGATVLYSAIDAARQRGIQLDLTTADPKSWSTQIEFVRSVRKR